MCRTPLYAAFQRIYFGEHPDFKSPVSKWGTQEYGEPNTPFDDLPPSDGTSRHSKSETTCHARRSNPFFRHDLGPSEQS